MALRDWQTGWQGSLGWNQLSSREFAANPIGVFFDPDSACEAFKSGKGHEELHRAIMAGQFMPSVPTLLIGLPPELYVRPPPG
jgi:catechol 2,3-dioxygenase